MDSIIEVQRQTHEEIEIFERALYQTLSKPQPTHEARLQNEHKASQILDRIEARITSLSNLYEDEETRKAELDALSAPPQASDLTAFYSRLTKIQEHYAKYPDSMAAGYDPEIAAFIQDEAAEHEDEEYEEDDRVYFVNTNGRQQTEYLYDSHCLALFGRGELWKVP